MHITKEFAFHPKKHISTILQPIVLFTILILVSFANSCFFNRISNFYKHHGNTYFCSVFQTCCTREQKHEVRSLKWFHSLKHRPKLYSYPSYSVPIHNQIIRLFLITNLQIIYNLYLESIWNKLKCDLVVNLMKRWRVAKQNSGMGWLHWYNWVCWWKMQEK